MNYKALFTNIKVKLGVETNFESMNLEDGTAIEAESFEAGEAVFIVAEDGNIPLPVGSYTLEDGRTLAVEEEGIIATVGTPEVAEEEMAEEAPEYVTKADFEAAINSLTEMLASKFEKETVEVEAAAETEEVKAEELSAVEEVEKVELAAEPVKHIKPNPERQAEKKMNINLASKRQKTIADSVMAKIAQIK